MINRVGTVCILYFVSYILLAGCAGKKVKIDPSNPVYGPKNDFEMNYGYFITPDERKTGYVAGFCKNTDEAVQPFDEIDSLSEFHKFEKCFWEIRDTDPNTPENEFKDVIDSRIRDIENEIFASDPDIPLTRFDASGGLKGDLAHVYLFYGPPHYKEKLPEGKYTAELMVWYYFDERGRPLFRFLFYNRFGDRGYTLFKNHDALVTYEMLFNPLLSPLREISSRPVPTAEDLFYLWEELAMLDPTWAFRSALFEFSYYSDVNISKALAPPEAMALIAERLKPTIFGQPDIPEGTQLFESRYYSFVPAYLRNNADLDSPTFLMLIVLHKNLDWERQGDSYVTSLNLRISFQHKQTRRLIEFFTSFKKELTQAEFDKKDANGEVSGSMVVFPVLLQHWDGEKFTLPLRDMLKELEAGEYVINIYLQHNLTKKYNSWREEIMIK